MIIEILAKLSSETLLSLYPIFVKNIGLPISLQTWSRFFSYALISVFFINYSFVYNTLFTYTGIILSFITIIHIYTSYRGFKLLDGGVAYSIFYLYPIMILLMSGNKIQWYMFLALIGVYLLASNDLNNVHIDNNSEIIEGVIMILFAAFTEAIIYFLVRDIKTLNNWNHIFISYFFGAVLLSGWFMNDISVMKLNSRISLSLLINAVIGLLGYLLRFYAVSRLDANIYAPLSYFGIVMSFIYGIFINGEFISLKKIMGVILIIISNYLLL